MPRPARPSSVLPVPVHVDVITHGTVAAAEVEAAREQVGALDEAISMPILGARVVLTSEANPRIARPARAEGELNLQGTPIHARVSAETMPRAVHDLAQRLEANAHRFRERLTTRKRRPAEATAGEWFHGAWSGPRPGHYPRPPGAREIIRRRSFASGALSEAQAAAELAALDHDFLLFEDADTGADAVLYRRDDGRLGIVEPPDAAPPPFHHGPVRQVSRFSEPVALETAVAEMDELDHRFLYFVDASSGRGSVIYLRYDGHHGLIEIAA